MYVYIKYIILVHCLICQKHDVFLTEDFYYIFGENGKKLPLSVTATLWEITVRSWGFVWMDQVISEWKERYGQKIGLADNSQLVQMWKE